ncbi:MAG: hypothetical protein JEZ07_05290 [Phycisphaerae bacterium]|nr:hypothetical protein [Phycisphaerae bacterium]
MQNEAEKNVKSGPPQWLTGSTEAENYEDPQEAFDWQGDAKSTGRPMLIMLACAFAGMIGLYFFGIKQKPTPASDEQVQNEARIDVALAKLTGDKNIKNNAQAVGKIVKTFYDYPMNQQVSLDDLRKNPFAWVQQQSASTEEATSIQTAQAAQAENNRKNELQNAFALLKLQSIAFSAKNSRCMIDDELYSSDQQVGLFKITEIAAEKVVLEADDMDFVLRL